MTGSWSAAPNGDVDAHKIEANLYKLVNVIDVQDVTHQPSVNRDLALIKVRVGPDRRARVNGLAEISAPALWTWPLILSSWKLQARKDKIEGLTELLRPIGIVEMVRTGQVAMTPGVNDGGAPRFGGVTGNRYQKSSRWRR